jgi:hypothetical protein
MFSGSLKCQSNQKLYIYIYKLDDKSEGVTHHGQKMSILTQLGREQRWREGVEKYFFLKN